MQNEAFIFLLTTFIITSVLSLLQIMRNFLTKHRLQQWTREQSSRVDAEIRSAYAAQDSAAVTAFREGQRAAQRAYEDQLRDFYQDEDTRP